MKESRSLYLAAAAVAFVTCAVYFKAVHNGFMEWDDGTYVVGNPHLRSLDSSFFKWAFFDFYASNWHPLTWFSHLLDYKLWGLNPFGHHLTSVMLHGLNSFFVVLLAAELMEIARTNTSNGKLPYNNQPILIAAGVSGLLFGLHPLHVESVVWIAERKDLLCTLFFLLSVRAYILYARSAHVGDPSAKRAPRFMDRMFVAGLGFYMLALLSKPMAVTLPLVLLILDWYPLYRIHSLRSFVAAMREKLFLLALSVGSSVITFIAQNKGGAVISIVSLPLKARLLIAAKALSVYLIKMVAPFGLVPFYPYPRHVRLMSVSYLPAVAFLAAVTVACLAIVKRGRIWLAAWACYVVTLIPVLGIVQVGNQAMADRYTYIPSVAPFLIAGAGIAWAGTALRSHVKGSFIPILAFGGILLMSFSAMAFATRNQISVWKDSITLWTYVIDKNHGEEDNAVNLSFAYNNRAVAFHRLKEFDSAISDYSKAIGLDPGDEGYYKNRATAYSAKKQYDRALADNSKALEINPEDSGAIYNISCIYALKNDPEESCRWLRRSIEKGYADWENVNHDPDLENIRQTQCFKAIIENVGR